MKDTFSGLSSAQARKRLNQFGKNELSSRSKTTALTIFIRQFKNFLVVLLFAAAAISAGVGEYLDAGIILLILGLNIVLGFFQEYKAENAIESLKKLTASKVRVIRDGRQQQIDSTLLVPGDIVFLSEGDKVPADGTVYSSVRLAVNEASLTGESLPVSKNEHDKDNNLLYMGTIISSGKTSMEITQTGQSTRFGTMATSLGTIEKRETPLTYKITKLGLQISIAAFAVTIALFGIGILREHDIVVMLLTSISLLVAAVPEGLPAVITITLAVGLQRMARRKAILRKLGAIEALGNTTVIATDKTGTLTENKMSVVEVWANKQTIPASEVKTHLKNQTLSEYINCAVLCNNATISSDAEKKTTVLGDQTEGSLLLMAQNNGVEPDSVRNKGEFVDEFSFDSTKKMMSVVWKKNNDITLYTKGAPEKILELSGFQMINGVKKKLTEQDKKNIRRAIDRAGEKGLRVLALAMRPATIKFSSRDAAERNLILLGLAGIADPPRKDVAAVISQTKQAGINTIMITGDNPLTARYIGVAIGLIDGSGSVITGSELAKLSDKKLEQILQSSCIFARTSPEDKYRIVKKLQQMGHSVTVTGDGINDALALKQADVGVAMGLTGTDVAKEVSDMVITDDNFVSIVNAIREGRIIYDNIVKSVMYLVSCNLGEMLLIVAAVALGFPLPLLPVQILWVNLVTDGLPALSLAFDPGSGHIMKKRSPSSYTAILNKSSLPVVAEFGALVGLVPLAFYSAGLLFLSVAESRTIAFTTLVMVQMIVIFLLRPGQKLSSNKLLLAAVAVSLGLQYLIMTVPVLKTIFHIV